LYNVALDIFLILLHQFFISIFQKTNFKV